MSLRTFRLILSLLIISLYCISEAAALPILSAGQASRAKDDNRRFAVKIFTFENGSYHAADTIKPFPKSFGGGVHVAIADVDGDFAPELIVGAGPGKLGPKINIYKINANTITKTPLETFFGFDSNFRGGVNIAAGYFTPDVQQDLIFGAAKNSSEVKVFDVAKQTPIFDFFAFEPTLKGGVNVAAGDINGDFRPDIVVGGGAGGGPRVKVFDGTTGAMLTSAIGSFFAYDSTQKGGVRVAVGDVNGDGRADIITGAGPGGGPHVRVFNGVDGSQITDFLAFKTSFKGGVSVAAGDVNGDGFADIIVGPSSGKQPVKLFDGKSLTESTHFSPFGKSYVRGVFLYQF